MKILYIDPICYPQHATFNILQLSALQEEYENVDLCIVEGYEKILNLNSKSIVYSIPNNLIKTNGGLNYRLTIYRVLKAIKRNINLSIYDVILISCFDEISLYFVNFPKSFLFNHNNIQKLEHSKIKQYFYKLISKKHTQIVLTHKSVEYLKKLGIKNIILHSHGLPQPFNIQISSEQINSSIYKIFVPSKSSTDSSLYKDIINNSLFKEWLKNNNIEIILRGDMKSEPEFNIKVISGYIPNDDYQQIFNSSDCILIYYPLTFQYRVSAVLLECLANGKQCLIRDIPNFNEYKSLIGSNAFFNDIEDLQKKILLLRSSRSINFERKELERIYKIDYSFLKEKINKS